MPYCSLFCLSPFSAGTSHPGVLTERWESIQNLKNTAVCAVNRTRKQTSFSFLLAHEDSISIYGNHKYMASVKQNATVSQKLTVPGGCHYFGEVSFVWKFGMDCLQVFFLNVCDFKDPICLPCLKYLISFKMLRNCCRALTWVDLWVLSLLEVRCWVGDVGTENVQVRSHPKY